MMSQLAAFACEGLEQNRASVAAPIWIQRMRVHSLKTALALWRDEVKRLNDTHAPVVARHGHRKGSETHWSRQPNEMQRFM